MVLDIGSGPPPLITVITPTYNRWKLLRRAIRSVLEQSFTDWELIVVDDGSRDGTYDFAEATFDGDPRCRYHYTTNRGLAMARNIGLMIGRGKYFTFLDSDDWYTKSHLTLRANYLLAHPEVELLHGGVRVTGAQTVADKHDPSRQIPITDCVVGGTFFIRRDLVERLQGFRDVIYGDDHEFFERATAAGAVIRKIDKPTYRYNRTEEDSLCAIVERDGIDGIKAFRGIRG